jgi:leucyl aminopeptidase
MNGDIMDFRAITSAATLWAETPCDALVLILDAEATDHKLPAPLAGLLDDALKSGDLALKAGRSLYVHRPSGVRSPRLVWSVAANASAKALRSAAQAAFNTLKPGGARHVAVARCGAAV